MFIGAVKWFNQAKGFGMLAIPLEDDLFFHIKGFDKLPKRISPGDVIIGKKQQDALRGRVNAHYCRFATEPADWRILMTLLSRPDDVEITFKSGRHWYSLLDLAVTQFLAGKEEQHVMLIITNYFEQELRPECFIAYARVLEKNIPKSLGHDAGTVLLERVLVYFGSRITPTILFNVWQEQTFHYIGYPDTGDYEIPEELLTNFATLITLEDLHRIKNYSYGPSFCKGLITAMLEDADAMNLQEINEMMPYLVFLEEKERAEWTLHLEQLKGLLEGKTH